MSNPKPADLPSMPTGEIVKLYNKLNPEKPVKKFVDRATAIKRVTALLTNDNKTEEPPAPKVEDKPAAKTKPPKAPKEPKERKKRQMYFKFPKKEKIGVIRDEKSLRFKLKERLQKLNDKGEHDCKFDDLVAVTKKWDVDNHKKGKSVANVVRRAYEGTRLLHYYVGYGMDQTADGTIKLVGTPTETK